MLALTPRQQGWLVGLILFGTVLIAYVASLPAAQLNTDALANSFASWHFAHTGNVFFDGARLPTMKGGLDYFGSNPEGHVVVSRTPGQIWAAVPFYLLLSDSNFEHFSSTAGSVAASFFSALAILLFFLTVRPRLPLLGAIGAASALAFATPIWSVAAETLWPHSVTILSIAGAAWAASRGRWGLAGCFLGLGILARPHVAVIAAVLGMGISLSRRRARPAIRVALGSGVFLTMLVTWNRLVFGQWTLAGGYTQGLADVIPGHRESRLGDGYPVQLAGLFLSPNRGFLVWTPIVLLLLPLVWKYRRALPDWSVWLAAGGVTYSLVQAALNEWTGGSGFNGYRLTLELLMCLAPILTLAAARAGHTVQVLAPYVLGYQMAIISVATIFHGSLQEPSFWTDSVVFEALREQTALTAGLLVGFGIAGWLVSHRIVNRLATVQEATVEPAEPVEVLRD